jgi:hypothetical protein
LVKWFSGEEALKLVECYQEEKSTLYDVQNDDGKSQHIDDRRAYNHLDLESIQAFN